MKNTLERIKQQIANTEEWISDLEDKIIGNQLNETSKKKTKNKDNLRDYWDNIKHSNIHIGIPQGEKRKEQKLYLIKK